MSYPRDISYEQWEVMKGHFDMGNDGKRRKYTQRTLVNAVLYSIQTGCQWRQLPKDFPHYQTVFSFETRERDRGIWEP